MSRLLFSLDNTNGSSCSQMKQSSYYKRESTRNNKVTLILNVIAVTFGTSWLPWHLINIYIDFRGDNQYIDAKKLLLVHSITHLIVMTTTTSNAILYGLLNTNIRREMRKYL